MKDKSESKKEQSAKSSKERAKDEIKAAKQRRSNSGGQMDKLRAGLKRNKP